MNKRQSSFDYIIVGGGTAGCVLAERLSADTATRVLLLEAGPAPRSLWIRMPAGMARLFVNSPYNWSFLGEPEQQLGGRQLYMPQGRTLGGSSAINGMAFVRGQPEDFDGWRDAGATGWGWEDVRPRFERLEQRGNSPWRGADGPVSVSDPAYVHSSTEAFRAAAQAAGIAANADYNGPRQEGVSLLQFSIRDGRRETSATAYLDRAARRGNLSIQTGAHAERILFEGNRACGIAYRHNGKACEARLEGELIISSGALGSPALLLRSGIGPATHLRELGIPVLADREGVGANLIDHPYLHLTYSVDPAASLNQQLHGLLPYFHGARWLFSRKGPLTIGASQAAVFVRSNASVPTPDLQINFRPISHVFDSAGRLAPDPEHRVTAAICGLRPASSGRLWLKSPDGEIAFTGGYLSAPEDEDVLLAGLRWARRIFAAQPLAGLVRSEDKPGTHVATEADLRAFIRATVQPMIHPVGTCRMGSDDQSVVDPCLRLRGVGGVRVVDSSIMPRIVSGNTAAATYMIGEMGADFILADQKR